MANTLMLETRAFLITTRYCHYTKCSSLGGETITFLRPYPILSTSLTLSLKPYTNPTLMKPFMYTPMIKCKANALDSMDTQKLESKEESSNPLGFVLDAISSASKALNKAAVAALLASVLMIMYNPRYAAWAASGGRMGGHSFSSGGRSSSSSSSSRSSSSSGSSRSSSSGSWSSSSSNKGSSSSSSSPSKPLTEAERRRIVWFCVCLVVACMVIVALYVDSDVTSRESNSVVKLQVGLFGTARSLQSELNRIALTADTSTSVGISYVLKETIRALLEHPDYWISAYSSVDTKRRIKAGEKLFHKLSAEEREKFDEETLVNVNNVKKLIISTRSIKATGVSSEYIVITVLVAAFGVLKLPTIEGKKELKEALEKLGSIYFYNTMAAEVLWTPQEENDTLSEKELVEDYPLLKPLGDMKTVSVANLLGCVSWGLISLIDR